MCLVRRALRRVGLLENAAPKGGELHPRLNTGERPIAYKYREGKMQRTLKRESKVLEIARKETIATRILNGTATDSLRDRPAGPEGGGSSPFAGPSGGGGRISRTVPGQRRSGGAAEGRGREGPRTGRPPSRIGGGGSSGVRRTRPRRTAVPQPSSGGPRENTRATTGPTGRGGPSADGRPGCWRSTPDATDPS